jgi:hypothetical protein
MNLKQTARTRIPENCIGASVTVKGYQHRTTIVQNETSDLVADFHSYLARQTNHFSHLLNVHGVNDVGQTKIHRAELLVSHNQGREP